MTVQRDSVLENADVAHGPMKTCEGDARKSVSVLGATGSVGLSTLDLIGRAPDQFDVKALTAHSNVDKLIELARRFDADFAVIGDEAHYEALKSGLAGTGTRAGAGDAALIEAGGLTADWVMACVVGSAGLRPTLAAVEQGGVVALANKECLVSAGDYFMRQVRAHGATLLPVDSEHSAVYQTFEQDRRESVTKITLTASGGPFRAWTAEALQSVTPKQALKHPNWSMGAKITIDSATLMNKGLELIEAHHLFEAGPDMLGVVVHPESIVHCLVSYEDGSVLAHLGHPDMRTPISVALSWPERMATPVRALDLAEVGSLTFEPPDNARFPCLGLARSVLGHGDYLGTALNSANEIAVEAFLSGKLDFQGIPKLVEKCLAEIDSQTSSCKSVSLDDIFECDRMVRERALAYL